MATSSIEWTNATWKPVVGCTVLSPGCTNRYAMRLGGGASPVPGARSLDPAWVREIRDACDAQGIAFLFKQWGGTNKKKRGRILDGRTWDEFPAVIGPT